MNEILNNLIITVINNKFIFLKTFIKEGYIYDIKNIYHKYQKNNNIVVILLLIYQLNILKSKDIIYKNSLIKHYFYNKDDTNTINHENTKDDKNTENDENTNDDKNTKNDINTENDENTKNDINTENDDYSVKNNEYSVKNDLETNSFFETNNQSYTKNNTNQSSNINDKYKFKNIPRRLIKLYKKCLLKCHPDKTNDLFKQKLFLLLKEIEKENLPYLIYLIALHLNIKYEVKEIELLKYYIEILQINSQELFNQAQQSSAEINKMKK